MTAAAELVVTARPKRKREAARRQMRLEAPDGRMVQCPRGWRDDLGNGLRYRILASLRADGTCYVATPSFGYHLEPGQ